MYKGDKIKPKECKEKMWYLMQKYNFNKSRCLKAFRNWLAKKRIQAHYNYGYRLYDSLMKKCSVLPEFHQNLKQFYRNLTLMAHKVTKDALETGDIQDFLAIARLQMEALNIKGEQSNVVLQQYFQQMNQNVNIGENADEIIQRLQAGLEKFGPTLAGLRQIGTDNPRESTITVQATPKATRDS